MADIEGDLRTSVLVLGAGGFVGSRLVAALAREGRFRPIAAPHHPPHRDRWPGIEVRPCDATDPRAVAEALRDVDYVVNCVAGNDRTLVASTKALCDAARRTRVRRIVHISSMAIYGFATGLVKEATVPVPPLNGYAQAKRDSEQAILDYVRDGGDAVILRPGCIHGPGSAQWTTRIAGLLQSGRIGDLGPAGDGVCNLTYVEDLIAAIVASLWRPNLNGAIFNIADPDPPSWNEFFVRFARRLGATPVRRLSPRRLLAESRFLAPLLRAGGLAARAVRLPPRLIPEPITPSLVRLMRHDIQLDTSLAISRLGVPHTPLDRALDVSVRWLSSRQLQSTPAPREHMRQV